MARGIQKVITFRACMMSTEKPPSDCLCTEKEKTGFGLPLPLSPEGFELPCAHRLDPMTMKLFVPLRGT